MKFFYENETLNNFIPNGPKNFCKKSSLDIEYGFNHPTYNLEPYGDIIWLFETAEFEFNESFIKDNIIYFIDVFSKIKKFKNVRLVFSNFYEGKNISFFLDELKRLKERFQIPKTQIIIININFYIEKYDEFFTIISEPILLYDLSKNYMTASIHLYADRILGVSSTEEYLNTDKEKFFLSFNKNCNRLHRPCFLLWLIKNNLIDKTKFSILIKDELNVNSLYDYLKNTNLEDVKSLWKYYDVLDQIGEVILDWDYQNNPNDIFSNTGYSTKTHYSETIFSVVTETTFENNSLNITEKSFKPLANCHPFIIIGDQHINKKLEDFGFKLYDDLIDYTFDSIYDNHERFDAATKEVLRIHNLGKDYIMEWYKNNIEKIEYNKNVFLKYSNENITKKILNKIKMKKVLITGCCGLVGTHLIKKCLERGYEVVGVDINDKSAHLNDYSFKFYKMDLSITENIKNLLDFENPEVILNSFGIKGSPIKAKNYPVDFLYPSLKINTDIINECFKRDIWLVYMSSVGVYSPTDCFREDDVWKTLPSEHDWFPSWSKRVGELLLDAYKIQHNYDKWSIIRPANIFGEYDDFSGNGTIISTMIKKIHETTNNEIEAWGDGSPVRDFVYAGDVADAVISLYENKQNVITNFGSGIVISIKELIELMSVIIGKKTIINWDTTKPNGDLRRLMDTSRQKELNLLPKLGLEEALKITYNYYKNCI